MASKDPFKRYVKASIARRAAQEAGCPLAILNVNLPRETKGKEEAVFVSFYSRGATYVDRSPPPNWTGQVQDVFIFRCG